MDWRKYIYALLRTLERAETPFVLGVYGGWGSGKTSFVNCLGDAAKQEEWPRRGEQENENPETDAHRYDWRVVKVNPWECDTPEDAKRLIATSLWRGFFNEARWASWHEGRMKFRAIGRTSDSAATRVVKGISNALNLGGVGDAVEAMFSSDASIAQVFRGYFREDLKLALREKKNADRPARVLVIIDDLDRCRQEVIPEVLETIKLYLDQEGCVFVLAADPTRIGQVLGAAYAPKDVEGKPQDAEQVGQRYLDKIVQLPFWVPRMDDDAAERFFDECACMLHPEVAIGDDMRALLIDHVLQRNPRSIKRFCLTHGLLAEVGDDLNGDKLAKMLAIDWYFPGMRKGYVRPGHGASLLLEDQRVARGEAEEGEDFVKARTTFMPHEDAKQYAARLGNPRLIRILAAKPAFEDKEDVDRYFDLTSAGPSQTDPEDEFQAALKMLEADSPEERRQGFRLLAETGDKRAVEPLLERLGDENADVRGNAAGALGLIGDARAVEPLIERLKDENAHVRYAAAVALSGIGDERAVETLIELLGDEGASVRWGAARALGEIGDERAVEPLIEWLGDEDANVRSMAARALGKLGDERAVEPLIEVLGEDDVFVHDLAAGALGWIGDERAVEPLIEVLGEDDVFVRRRAAGALGRFGAAAEAALPRLRELKGEDEDESVREKAREAIERIEAAKAEQEAGEQSESDAEDE